MMTDLTRLKSIGKGAVIGEYVKIVNPEMVEIGDHSRIDDFTIILGGQGIQIGRYVHIASFCSVIGGGSLYMEDFAGLAAGCRLLTATDDFSGAAMTNPCVPKEYLSPIRGRIAIRRHAVIATNAVVFPNVEIGAGAVVGASSVVNRNVREWTINVGNPVRAVAERRRDIILSMERSLEAAHE